MKQKEEDRKKSLGEEKVCQKPPKGRRKEKRKEGVLLFFLVSSFSHIEQVNPATNKLPLLNLNFVRVPWRKIVWISAT